MSPSITACSVLPAVSSPSSIIALRSAIFASRYCYQPLLRDRPGTTTSPPFHPSSIPSTHLQPTTDLLSHSLFTTIPLKQQQSPYSATQRTSHSFRNSVDALRTAREIGLLTLDIVLPLGLISCLSPPYLSDLTAPSSCSLLHTCTYIHTPASTR